MSEPIPIPECREWVERLREVKRLVSADWVDLNSLSPLLKTTHSAVDQCYGACISAIANGKTVLERNQPLTLPEIEQRIEDGHAFLNRCERVAQNLPFSHWAGGSLQNHDNEPSVSQVFDEKLNYLYDRHAFRDHVGINSQDLEQTRWHKQLRVNSTFHNVTLAEYAIARTLAFNWDKITVWLSLTEAQERDWWKRNGLVLHFEMGKDIGYAIKHGRSKKHITTHVRIVLIRDPRASKGFWIKDAYPVP
jgi:Bacterial CdiA-CT RNAse A domain